VVNPFDGLMKIQSKAIILAMGCRERTRSQIQVPGERPSGVFTAGVAQHFINKLGILPGKKVVILGSGDVGMIMARRLTLEGATVEGVYEIMPEPGGLTRNVVQCLEDYMIPLHLSHTITDIEGRDRIEGVTVSRVDKDWNLIKDSERFIQCDTVITSVGLIPENELSKTAGVTMDPVTGGPVVSENMETSIPGIFACGNVVHVHDLVDDVSNASSTAGKGAAQYIKEGKMTREKPIRVVPGRNVRYVVPQIVTSKPKDGITFYLRVLNTEKDARVIVTSKEQVIYERRERIVKPPEMVKATIPLRNLENINTDILIEVKS